MSIENKVPNPFELITDQLNRIELMLAKIIRHQETELQMDLDTDDSIALAMRITGLKKKSIYNLVNKRLIPHSKKGNRLYFDRSELEAWKKSGKRLTVDEPGRKYR